MWPDRVSNPRPLTYESGTLPIALRGPAALAIKLVCGITGNRYHILSTITHFMQA